MNADEGSRCMAIALEKLSRAQSASDLDSSLKFAKKAVKLNASLASEAAKVVSFIDLAGHERYLRTTVYGLTAHEPDYVMVVVGANHGITRMTKEHVGMAIALNVPLFVVVTKVDLCPEPVMRETMKQLHRLLKLPGARKQPYVVKSNDELMVAANGFGKSALCPIFCISSVDGTNVPLLRQFFNLMPSRRAWAAQDKLPTEFLIDQYFNVPGVGLVVAGTLLSGAVHVNHELLMGGSVTTSVMQGNNRDADGTIDREAVVTTVTEQSEIDKLRWWQQGDVTLETAEMLDKRHANRHARVVLVELENWWSAALHATFPVDRVASAEGRAAAGAGAASAHETEAELAASTTPAVVTIDERRYVDIFVKIGLALLEDDERTELASDVVEARENAEAAWRDDSRGAGEIAKAKWLDSLFELADTWTMGVDAAEIP